MKAFFWKPFIIDPAKPEHKELIWSKVKEHPITPDFMDRVVEAFHDKRAAAGGKGPTGDGGEEIIKVTGPVKKQFFSPEESKSLQMSMPKLPRAEMLLEGITVFTPGVVTNDQVMNLHRCWPKDSNLQELAM